MSARRRLVAPLGALALLALAGAGCGEDDFENDPRPATPVEITARVDEREVVVSPDKVGAGLVTFTLSNQSDQPVTLTLSGPTDAIAGESPPGGTANLKASLEEGEYEVTAGEQADVRPDTLVVGPARATSQNDLLKP